MFVLVSALKNTKRYEYFKNLVEEEAKAASECFRTREDTWFGKSKNDPEPLGKENNTRITFRGHGGSNGFEKVTPEEFYELLKEKKDENDFPESVETLDFIGCTIGFKKNEEKSWIEKLADLISKDSKFAHIKNINGIIYHDTRDRFDTVIAIEGGKTTLFINKGHYEEYQTLRKKLGATKSEKANIESELKLAEENLKQSSNYTSAGNASKIANKALKASIDNLLSKALAEYTPSDKQLKYWEGFKKTLLECLDQKAYKRIINILQSPKNLKKLKSFFDNQNIQEINLRLKTFKEKKDNWQKLFDDTLRPYDEKIEEIENKITAFDQLVFTIGIMVPYQEEISSREAIKGYCHLSREGGGSFVFHSKEVKLLDSAEKNIANENASWKTDPSQTQPAIAITTSPPKQTENVKEENAEYEENPAKRRKLTQNNPVEPNLEFSSSSNFSTSNSSSSWKAEPNPIQPVIAITTSPPQQTENIKEESREDEENSAKKRKLAHDPVGPNMELSPHQKTNDSNNQENQGESGKKVGYYQSTTRFEKTYKKKALTSFAVDAFKKDIGVSENLQLGKAVDNNGCFFDSLAQILNHNKKSHEYTERSLRSLCGEIYENSKQAGDINANNIPLTNGKNIDWDNIQFTQEDFDQMNQNIVKTAIMGSWGVHTRFLIEALNFDKICFVEITEDGKTLYSVVTRGETAINVITESEEDKASREEIKSNIKNGQMPAIILEGFRPGRGGVGEGGHYVPILHERVEAQAKLSDTKEEKKEKSSSFETERGQTTQSARLSSLNSSSSEVFLNPKIKLTQEHFKTQGEEKEDIVMTNSAEEKSDTGSHGFNFNMDLENESKRGYDNEQDSHSDDDYNYDEETEMTAAIMLSKQEAKQSEQITPNQKSSKAEKQLDKDTSTSQSSLSTYAKVFQKTTLVGSEEHSTSALPKKEQQSEAENLESSFFPSLLSKGEKSSELTKNVCNGLRSMTGIDWKFTGDSYYAAVVESNDTKNTWVNQFFEKGIAIKEAKDGDTKRMTIAKSEQEKLLTAIKSQASELSDNKQDKPKENDESTKNLGNQ